MRICNNFGLLICESVIESFLQNLYEATCQLREKRLDIEEALAEEKKINETWKKEVDGLNKKLKVIGSALTTAQQDLEAFQVSCTTVKFLNFQTPEIFAVIYLKFKQRGKTLGYFVKKMQTK